MTQLRYRSYPKNPRRQAGAAKGGQATLKKSGREHYAALGRTGGRPTWQSSLAQARPHQPSRAGGGPCRRVGARGRAGGAPTAGSGVRSATTACGSGRLQDYG